MLEIKELQPLIIEWAKERNITNPDKQYLKILEEVGETAKAILENNEAEIKDGIGDIAVTVIIYYWLKGNPLRVENLPLGYSSDTRLELTGVILYSDYGAADILTTLYKLAEYHGTSLKECLNLAWNEIKDRKGKTVGGTFIKNK